ncbi:D-alanine--D-alanine ligase [Pelagibacterales bacterium SAG-MED31]|nr:D-alanine--D-alanine ligase [Pelagibacterales bacterium SAG-MED31]
MKKILILQGGYNEEHKVSINTAKEVAKALKKLKINFKTLTVNPDTFKKDILRFSSEYICFNALHGTFGEDGKIQKILKNIKFRYTHSNQISSANSFNKLKSKKIANKFNIITPSFKIVKCRKINQKLLFQIKKKFKKFVLKPVSSGSSYGLKIIKSNNDLKIFLEQLSEFKKKFQNDELFILEKFISGKELTVSVLENNLVPQSLQVTEIVSLNKTYDYQAKYSKGFSNHYIPARISKHNYTKCLKLALQIHKIFKCKTLSRIDFIYNNKNNKIYFLEINSQPGMTKLSLLPEQANYQKIKFEDIVIELINNA